MKDTRITFQEYIKRWGGWGHITPKGMVAELAYIGLTVDIFYNFFENDILNLLHDNGLIPINNLNLCGISQIKHERLLIALTHLIMEAKEGLK